MLKLTSSERAEKLGQLQAISDAIHRLHTLPRLTFEQAVELTRLHKQRLGLRATMPLELVHG